MAKYKRTIIIEYECDNPSSGNHWISFENKVIKFAYDLAAKLDVGLFSSSVEGHVNDKLKDNTSGEGT